MTGGTIRIDRRFRGPPESGNGGYVCGRLARYLDGPAAVRLRVPPPLDRGLEVRDRDAGVILLDGGRVVAEARPASIEVDVPRAPGFEAATVAARRFRGFESHWFPTCFVCGPEREPDDGLQIFPGPVEGRDLVAAPWVPDPSLDAGNGQVAPEFLWAALDCPGAFTFAAPEEGAVVLGELAAEVRGGVSVSERCVIVAWELEHEGRKHRTATALFGESGECRAVGLGIWIEVADPVGEKADPRPAGTE